MSPAMTLPVRYYCRYPFENPRGLVDTSEDLALADTAFVLVDVYGRGFDEGDPIPDFPPLFLARLHPLQAEIVRDRIRPALDAARGIGLPVVYVENRWHPAAWGNSVFADLVARTESGHLGSFDEVYVGTEYNEYSDVIAPATTDYIVEKTMYDGFFRTTLDTVLRNLSVRNLVFVGFTADICLLNTVIGALDHNYNVVVLRDCVLGAEFEDTVDDLSVTRFAVRYYEAMVGFTSTSADFIRAARASGSPPAEAGAQP
jgi:ureidoacrylate peracid hydrolase